MATRRSTCLRWFFKIVPSGSGRSGSSASTLAGVSLFESKSTIQMSSGNLRMINVETLRKLTNIINHAVRGLPEVLLVHQERCRYADNESTRNFEEEKLSQEMLTRNSFSTSTYGVGASSNCSAQLGKSNQNKLSAISQPKMKLNAFSCSSYLMHVGSSGITGNMYSSG